MRTLALIGLACGAGIRCVHGQITANVEVGVSEVQYDGFLASGAASVSPAVRWEHPRGRGFINARGTYLRFESGRSSLDGSAHGSWFAPLGGHWRGELGLAAGSSDYANIASFNHIEAESRLHLVGGQRGGWVGATVGRSSFRGDRRPVTVVGTGLWLLHDRVTLFVSMDRSNVGDTVYSDLRTSARLRSGSILLEGVLGARVWSRGGGRGVFGEGSATVIIGPQTALVVSAGRYPTDVVSGSLAGRYVTAALRLGTMPIRRPATAARAFARKENTSGGSDYSAISEETRLEIRQVRGEEVRLAVFAPGAIVVEVSGDFTDWQPVPLSRRGVDPGSFGGTFRMSRGMHRINVRRDGGRWMAPAGTTRTADDYDGQVGIFLVP